MSPAPARAVWVVDSEYQAVAGEPVRPHCVVGYEMLSGRWVSAWGEEQLHAGAPPYDLGPDSLFISFFAPAELSVHHALGWKMPERVVDLWAEVRALTNGIISPKGLTLLKALALYHLPLNDAVEKDLGRALAIRGAPFSEAERTMLLEYCRHDVEATARLLGHLWSRIDWQWAVVRGRYLTSVARMEAVGLPIDGAAWAQLLEHWDDLRGRLIARVDQDYGVYDGVHFNHEKFGAYLTAHAIEWPLTPTGRLKVDGDTFKEAARTFPALTNLKELRDTLEALDQPQIVVSADQRNRFGVRPLRTLTGRNAPMGDSILGRAVWLRSMIRPAEGRALIYADWSFQEVLIAAQLSRDPALIAACRGGDPYLAFAIAGGLAPTTATKASHRALRDLVKMLFLAVGYGMSAFTFARRSGLPLGEAHRLLQLHHDLFPKFWTWKTAVLDRAQVAGYVETGDGWRWQLGEDFSPRTANNFPCQGGGASMLRLACSELTEQGFVVAAPLHDAVFIECDQRELDDVVPAVQAIMARAGERLFGCPFPTSATIVRWPDSYSDPRGAHVWTMVRELLQEVTTA